MGTDIHITVQQRQADGWKTLDPKLHGVLSYGEKDWCEDRNYNLFAILANVRNGRGFAGVVTGGGFNVISEPRGYPEDLEPSFIEDADWGHSHTWLSLKEILDFAWDQTTTSCGVVTPGEFVRWQTEGRPQSWSGGISGQNIRTVPNEEMAEMIRTGEASPIPKGPMGLGGSVFTNVSWEIKYEDSAQKFLGLCRENLLPLGDPDDIRFLIFFDS